MLERLELINFQKHEKLRIRCDPRVTTFCGRSDIGKSAIVRALRWVALNRPQGDDMVRWDADFARVRLWVDGRQIERRRGEGGNIYLLDGVEYRAFGNEPPGPVVELLRLDAINFQGQHASPYWLSLTAGQVSKELNAVVNLEAMDAALGRAAAGTRKAKAAVELTVERLEKARTERKALAWAKRASKALAVLEAQDAELNAIRRKCGALEALLARIAALQTAATRNIPQTDGIDRAKEEWETARDRRLELETLLIRLRSARTKAEQSEKRARESEAALRKLTADRCPVCGNPASPSPSLS